MKRAVLTALTMLAWGCGGNPLLKMAPADYAPFRVGSTWNYVDGLGAPLFTTKVLSGNLAYQVSNYPGFPGLSTVTATGSQVLVNGVLDRKLPYLTGNRWDLPGGANQTVHRTVDGYENVGTPAGVFVRCFRLKTEINTYNSVLDTTTTTGAFIWSAPNVGDVQFADIDAAGTVSITAKLGSYSLGP